jgi:hypothetical protein
MASHKTESPLRASSILCLLAVLVAACDSESGVTSPTPPLGDEPPAETIPSNPMDVIPADIRLWDAFDAKLILKQPDTNTLVVEGVIEGDAAERASEMEVTANEDGWETDVFTTHEGLATLILEKESRRLKVNFTQDGGTVGIHFTTRLPE